MSARVFNAKLKWGNGDRCRLPQKPVGKPPLARKVV
mgnify:CR=1 FL=1